MAVPVMQPRRLLHLLRPAIRLRLASSGKCSTILRLWKFALAAANAAWRIASPDRNPNVQLAIRYGRDWIEERRANPFVRSLKRATRKIRNKFRKLQERLKGD